MADCKKATYIVLCVAGFLLSAYAVYIENAKAKDKDYVAFCDIDENISCTSVLTSEYSVGLGIAGKLFGEDSIFNVPSAYYGVLLYLLLVALSISDSKIILYIQLVLNGISLVTSIFLLYILLFVIHTTCLVCYGIHAVNSGLLICVLLRLFCTKNGRKKLKKN